MTVVPLLKSNTPLVPADDAFADRMIIAPEDDTEPAPLATYTAPPVLLLENVSPAYK